MAPKETHGFDADTMTRVATLARLDLTEAERQQFSAQLTTVLDYVAQLQTVDTTAVAATSHPLALPTAWREDSATPSLDHQAALANAPDADRAAGLFRVPRVIG